MGAELLVLHIIGAQGITMHNQGPLAVDFDDGGIGNQSATGSLGEEIAHQEVTVTVHHVDGYAGAGEVTESVKHRLVKGHDRVIAQPYLKEVAENI